MQVLKWKGNRCASVVLAALMALMMMPGCTGLEPALLGVAASGVRTGAAVYNMGKLDAAVAADGATMADAVDKMCDELGLSITEKDADQDRPRWDYVIHDERRNAMIIRVDQRAAKMTRVQVEVGLFGPEVVARLLLKRILVHADLMGHEASE